MKNYTPIIGLEVHVELKTASKMFCRCSANYFGREPNTHTCPVCLGFPGALPVANAKAIEWCIMIALSLNCEINLLSKFDRKNYFYPDLPKGYQISQYDLPFGKNGSMELKNGKKIRIRRVHMEEDTAKLTHIGHPKLVSGSNVDKKMLNQVQHDNVSLIDFNRSGVPLVEIVTEPDFESASEVKEYLQKLQQIVRYLDVSNADMEKGDMRLEPNISLRPVSLRGVSPKETDEAISKRSPRSARDDSALPPYKVEVKNINSFRFVEKAIDFEIKRQANDYRYFPEPDIPPIHFTKDQISSLESQVPELPDARFSRFLREFSLTEYDSKILTREKNVANYFEEAVSIGKEHNISPKQIANWIINKKPNVNDVLPASLVKQIVSSTQVTSIDEADLEKVILQVLSENQKAVDDFKNGKENVIMFLVGQVMRQFKTKINANSVKELILKSIGD
ncbi:MAG: Asp-tRNA(Asn)/Glu-tRNA(Gln) amidotransferase subunit GatB [Candidatus Levybacteria bacterium]|nr:Asp-tRNA(Asn)/Glu-tRNA(Gln) amidotransferase subunit GatB [Candidatus Levybacteria bacterium]